ncbi:hypothetical protein [Microbispora sp. CSR-4]|uniref:hypothetical protein n=1 Tax=Microbispora sp. CSR-4 TaxID=2592813 RepID=UPI0011C98A05|nr:hypothetical protein [Microbispora sp. CSR-4]
MRRALVLAALTAALTACSTTPTTAAAPADSPAPAIATSTTVASPTPTVDPACASEDLDTYFREIDAYTRRGAFDVEPKARLSWGRVAGWRLALGKVESDAELDLYKAAKSADEAVDDWLGADPGSLAQTITAMSIQMTAKSLAITCRVHNNYEFSKID